MSTSPNPTRSSWYKPETYIGLAGPVGLVVLLAAVSYLFSEPIRLQFQLALLLAGMVVALHTFAGNSGVLSFGHISFTSAGAFAAGLMSMATQQKQTVFPNLFGIIRDNELGNISSLILATAIGALLAFVVGIPMVRLNGLSAGIATFAFLGITRNVLRNWDKIGPGAKAIPSVPETTGTVQAALGLIIIVTVAFVHQQSRFGRRLRASREDGPAALSIGVSIYRERLFAFTLSGGLAGLAGGLYVHFLGSVTTDQLYIDLTFVTLAMLVVGGIGSLWGAVLGGVLISGLDSFLAEAQNGISVLGSDLSIPSGSRDIVLGALMVVVLLLRPDGITRGAEFAWRKLKLPGRGGTTASTTANSAPSA